MGHRHGLSLHPLQEEIISNSAYFLLVSTTALLD
jgi:hypothetical protein